MTSVSSRAAWYGLVGGLLLVLLAIVVPLLGWDVHARASGPPDFPPLHGLWDPKVGPGTAPALLIALLGWRYAAALSERLRWRDLLLTSYVVGLGWLLSLAFVDGSSGISRVLGNDDEYLQTARQVTDVHAMLQGFIAKIPYGIPDNWVTHVAGHPPGALLFFVGLVRVGLGGDFAAGMVVTVLVATTALAVLTTLRALGAEQLARRAAPFLVLGPAAIFMAVSADALFAAVAAWGMACLAIGATHAGRGRSIAFTVLAGLLLGTAVMMSYGLPLIGLVALVIVAHGRRWAQLPIAGAAALAVVLGFAVAGFAWWEAYPVLNDRYWAGIAKSRDAAYWLWGDLAALLICAGPLLAAGLTAVPWSRLRDRAVGIGPRLAATAAAAIVIADLSRMSKAEVERIWLPFVPWLLLSVALLPERWRRWGLALQLVTALVVQHLLYTSW